MADDALDSHLTDVENRSAVGKTLAADLLEEQKSTAGLLSTMRRLGMVGDALHPFEVTTDTNADRATGANGAATGGSAPPATEGKEAVPALDSAEAAPATEGKEAAPAIEGKLEASPSIGEKTSDEETATTDTATDDHSIPPVKVTDKPTDDTSPANAAAAVDGVAAQEATDALDEGSEGAAVVKNSAVALQDEHRENGEEKSKEQRQKSGEAATAQASEDSATAKQSSQQREDDAAAEKRQAEERRVAEEREAKKQRARQHPVELDDAARAPPHRERIEKRKAELAEKKKLREQREQKNTAAAKEQEGRKENPERAATAPAPSPTALPTLRAMGRIGVLAHRARVASRRAGKGEAAAAASHHHWTQARKAWMNPATRMFLKVQHAPTVVAKKKERTVEAYLEAKEQEQEEERRKARAEARSATRERQRQERIARGEAVADEVDGGMGFDKNSAAKFLQRAWRMSHQRRLMTAVRNRLKVAMVHVANCGALSCRGDYSKAGRHAGAPYFVKNNDPEDPGFQPNVTTIMERMHIGKRANWVIAQINTLTGKHTIAYINDIDTPFTSVYPPNLGWANTSCTGSAPMPEVHLVEDEDATEDVYVPSDAGLPGLKGALFEYASADQDHLLCFEAIEHGVREEPHEGGEAPERPRVIMRRIRYSDCFIWIVAAVSAVDSSTKIFYVNADFGALRTPPLFGWVLGQDGVDPPPTFKRKKLTGEELLRLERAKSRRRSLLKDTS